MKKSYGLISAIVMLMACGSGMQASAAQSKKIATPQMQPVRSAQDLANAFYAFGGSLAAFLDKEFKDKGYGERELIKGTKIREFVNNAQITTLVRLYEGITNLLAKASDGEKLKSLEDAAKDLLAQVSPALRKTPWFVQAQKSLPVSLKAGQASIATLQAEARAAATKRAEDQRVAQVARLAQEKAAREAEEQAKKLAEATAAANKAAAEKQAAEKQAAEKQAAEKAAREAEEQAKKLAAEKAALEKAALEKAALEKAALEKAALEKAAAEGSSEEALKSILQKVTAANKIAIQQVDQVNSQKAIVAQKLAIITTNQKKIQELRAEINPSLPGAVVGAVKSLLGSQGEKLTPERIELLRKEIDTLIASSETENNQAKAAAQKVYQSLSLFDQKEKEIKTDWKRLDDYTKNINHQSYLQKIRSLQQAVERALGNQVDRQGIESEVKEQVEGANQSLESQKKERALVQENPKEALKAQANADADQKVTQATKKLAEAKTTSEEVNALIDQIKAAKAAANQEEKAAEKATEGAKVFGKVLAKLFTAPYSNNKDILDQAIAAIKKSKELINQKDQEIRGSIKEVQKKIETLKTLNTETYAIWDSIKGQEVIQQKRAVAEAQEEIGRLEGAAKDKINLIIDGTESVSSFEVSLGSYKQAVEKLLKAIEAHYSQLESTKGFENNLVTPTSKPLGEQEVVEQQPVFG